MVDEEESMIENFMKAIEGTKSTADVEFEDLTIKLPGMSANMTVNGKISLTMRPVHERTKS
ncbi:MAG: hypothetical protein ACYDAO_09285 [Thermoplasmataceae archaeon]